MTQKSSLYGASHMLQLLNGNLRKACAMYSNQKVIPVWHLVNLNVPWSCDPFPGQILNMQPLPTPVDKARGESEMK